MFLPYQPREELAISLSAADLHLISMHPNTVGCLNPSKLYGIMAAGTPVLAITPEASDIWKTVTSERIGVAARPGDVSNIKAAIECCASGEVDLEAMGRRARNLVELRYDRKHGCERFSRVIDKYVKRYNVSSLLSTRRDEDRHALVGPHSDGKTGHRVTTPHLNVEAIDSNVSNTTS